MTSSIRAFVLRYLLLILVGYIALRSPLFMKMAPPTPDRPWADTPLEMLATPQHTTERVRRALCRRIPGPLVSNHPLP
jgi:hypothetical protein